MLHFKIDRIHSLSKTKYLPYHSLDHQTTNQLLYELYNYSVTFLNASVLSSKAPA
jgi:hypothetical protein